MGYTRAQPIFGRLGLSLLSPYIHIDIYEDMDCVMYLKNLFYILSKCFLNCEW